MWIGQYHLTHEILDVLRLALELKKAQVRADEIIGLHFKAQQDVKNAAHDFLTHPSDEEFSAAHAAGDEVALSALFDQNHLNMQIVDSVGTHDAADGLLHLWYHEYMPEVEQLVERLQLALSEAGLDPDTLHHKVNDQGKESTDWDTEACVDVVMRHMKSEF